LVNLKPNPVRVFKTKFKTKNVVAIFSFGITVLCAHTQTHRHFESPASQGFQNVYGVSFDW
jgi:hypothetical protein